MKNLENIIEIAASIIISGEATPENAIEMAINKDSAKCLEVVDDLNDMRNGYINDNNKNQKAYNILLDSVYTKLS